MNRLNLKISTEDIQITKIEKCPKNKASFIQRGEDYCMEGCYCFDKRECKPYAIWLKKRNLANDYYGIVLNMYDVLVNKFNSLNIRNKSNGKMFVSDANSIPVRLDTNDVPPRDELIEKINSLSKTIKQLKSSRINTKNYNFIGG